MQFATPEFRAAPDFSLIIPCYCEEPFLRKNTLELARILGLSRLQYEFIFVEDFSPDGTREVLRALAPTLEAMGISYQIVFHVRNRGRGAAVKSGIHAARGVVAGFIDIDLENLPDAILPMYRRVRDGELDFVVGRRIKTYSQFNIVRRLTHLGYRWLVHRIVDMPVSDSETGLKIFHCEKTRSILSSTLNDHWFWDTEVVLEAAAAGMKVGEHPVTFIRDHEKKSTVRVFRDSCLYLRELAAYALRSRRRPSPAPHTSA